MKYWHFKKCLVKERHCQPFRYCCFRQLFLVFCRTYRMRFGISVDYIYDLATFFWIIVTSFCSVYPCSLLDSDVHTVFPWTPATNIGLRFSIMSSEKICCVPNCGSEKEILHKFPNPIKEPERFRTWIYNIGGSILALDNDFIFKRRRVCHLHFETRYHTRSKFLSVDAIPRLCLPGFTLIRRPPLMDVTNQGTCSTAAEILQSQELPPEQSAISKRNTTKKMISNEQHLATQIKKLKTKNNSYQMRLKAYRWLSKIFVLPSPVTLSRMISRASLKPGINENIFEQLKRKVEKMKHDHRLCTLIFDEMSLAPHFDYNPKKDKSVRFCKSHWSIVKKKNSRSCASFYDKGCN